MEGTGGRSHYDGIKEETTGLAVFHYKLFFHREHTGNDDIYVDRSRQQ